MTTEMVEGRWYVSGDNPKHVVDHEGFTIADATSARKARQIIKEHNSHAELLAALRRMDGLVEKLWKSVPWGQTVNLPVQDLNEAPMQAKRAILNATTNPTTQPAKETRDADRKHA
jgi:hypothetical protein